MAHKAPLKRFFRGEDVDNLPREKLLEIIDILERQLQSANNCTRSIIEIMLIRLTHAPTSERRVTIVGAPGGAGAGSPAKPGVPSTA
jgi:hypothetical protein